MQQPPGQFVEAEFGQCPHRRRDRRPDPVPNRQVRRVGVDPMEPLSVIKPLGRKNSVHPGQGRTDQSLFVRAVAVQFVAGDPGQQGQRTAGHVDHVPAVECGHRRARGNTCRLQSSGHRQTADELGPGRWRHRFGHPAVTVLFDEPGGGVHSSIVDHYPSIGQTP